MRKRMFLVTIFILATLCLALARNNYITILEYRNKKILVEAEGKVQWIKMTNFPSVTWRELALVNEDNKVIAILIGNGAKAIQEKEGEKIKVKGLLKPHMWREGKKVSVIELRG